MPASLIDLLLTPQAVRLCRIEGMLRRSGCVSFDELRTALDVSRATLKRDLSCLREHLEAPISYDRWDNGYRLARGWSGVMEKVADSLNAP